MRDVEPELSLWRAALLLLLEDARTHALTGRDTHRAAFDDVMHSGPMLRRLCGFAQADPVLVRAAWLRTLPESRRAA